VVSNSVVEGHDASRKFLTCPNKDGGNILRDNSRIKVVVKDSAGNGIAAISAADIFVWMNGRSVPQGMYWDGPDSVIANSQYNPQQACPTLTAIYADNATDVNGSTYITLTGAGGVPDSTRKWGVLDSELPVYALGVRLQGRATSDSTNGSYTLRIRNVDCGGGIGTALNQGELVNSIDISFVKAHNYFLGGTYTYAADLDENGIINSIDEAIVRLHNGHKCHEP
jgi:hypothetical protein